MIDIIYYSNKHIRVALLQLSDSVDTNKGNVGILKAFGTVG